MAKTIETIISKVVNVINIIGFIDSLLIPRNDRINNAMADNPTPNKARLPYISVAEILMASGIQNSKGRFNQFAVAMQITAVAKYVKEVSDNALIFNLLFIAIKPKKKDMVLQ